MTELIKPGDRVNDISDGDMGTVTAINPDGTIVAIWDMFLPDREPASQHRHKVCLSGFGHIDEPCIFCGFGNRTHPRVK